MGKKGFTLIELLIVIAIIAILALIAVPNFLEAQVRAKVSRAHADLRTMATAIESYTVDWGRPPLGGPELTDADCHPDPYPRSSGMNWAKRDIYAQSRLTTPVAYISTHLKDGFYDKKADKDGRHGYVYHGYCCQDPDFNKACQRNFGNGYMWAMMSRGPTGGESVTAGVHAILDRAYGVDYVYDSSNGTMSSGSIVRTNKGIFTGRKGE